VKPSLELRRWSHCGVDSILPGKLEIHPESIFEEVDGMKAAPIRNIMALILVFDVS